MVVVYMMARFRVARDRAQHLCQHFCLACVKGSNPMRSIAAGMHINDSKCALGSRRDRHENIGRGLIGLSLFECIMNDDRLDGESPPHLCAHHVQQHKLKVAWT